MIQSPIRLKWTLTAGAVVVGLGASSAFLAPLASAHDSAIGGSITEGDVLDEFPEEIMIEFSAIPRDGFNNFAVTDQDTGEVLFSEEPEINERELTITTPEGQDPGDGDYMLGFQITSSDGHATRGGISFSVDSGESAGAAEDGQSEESTEASGADGEDNSDDSSTSTAAEEASEGLSTPLKWTLAGVGVLAVVAVAAVMLVKRRGYDAE